LSDKETVIQLPSNWFLPLFYHYHYSSIYTQKVGDSVVSDAGHFAFMNFFYGFNHPIYQEIEYRDLRNKAICSDQVRRQIDENLTFSSYYKPAKAQGDDFLLKQKRQKMLSPKGPVDTTTWQRISRCVDKFDSVYDVSSYHGDLTLR